MQIKLVSLLALSAAIGLLTTTIGVRGASTEATYTLKPKTVAWGYYDAKATPALRIRPELGGRYPAKRVIL